MDILLFINLKIIYLISFCFTISPFSIRLLFWVLISIRYWFFQPLPIFKSFHDCFEVLLSRYWRSTSPELDIPHNLVFCFNFSLILFAWRCVWQPGHIHRSLFVGFLWLLILWVLYLLCTFHIYIIVFFCIFKSL